MGRTLDSTGAKTERVWKRRMRQQNVWYLKLMVERSINSDVLTLILTRCSDCEEQLRVTFRPETVALASDDSAI